MAKTAVSHGGGPHRRRRVTRRRWNTTTLIAHAHLPTCPRPTRLDRQKARQVLLEVEVQGQGRMEGEGGLPRHVRDVR